MLDSLVKGTIGTLSLLVLSYALLHVAAALVIPLIIAWLIWLAFK